MRDRFSLYVTNVWMSADLGISYQTRKDKQVPSPGKSNGGGGQDCFFPRSQEEQVKYGELEEDEHELPDSQGLVSQTFSVDGKLS